MPNYLQLKQTGRLEGFDNTTRYHSSWDDLRFPVTAINPPGAVSDPTFDTTNGTLLFGATGTDVIYVIAQMPHSWKEGTAVVPHVHWYKTTSAAGNVLWRLEYKKFPIGAVGDADFTAIDQATPAISDGNVALTHALTSFGEIDMTGLTLSDMLLMKVSRIGDNAADTYGADAALMEFDIHYQIDGLGSQQEFTK